MKPLTALLLVLALLCTKHNLNAQKKLSIVGSSTSACYGPTITDSCYVGRLKAYFNKQVPNDTTITNEFSVGGYNVYRGMPSWYVSPYATPALQPDSGHNITAAIASHPDVILVNYPTNGYDFLTVSEIMFCLRTIRNEAILAGIPCYVTSTQPRTSSTFNTSAVKAKLALLKDSILAAFGSYAIDFYTGLINPADSSIRYDAGDNTHMNNTGHDSLYQRVLRKNIFGNLAALPAIPGCSGNFIPANGTIINTQTTAALSWNAVANASSYDVYIWSGNTPALTPIANIAIPSYTANNLLAATTYKWYVVPKNQTGGASNCATANTSSFTTAAVPIPVPACVSNLSPANGSVISTQTTATLTWNTSANASSYDVYIWTGATPSLTPIASITIPSYTANNLLAATTYKWYVVPKNQTGGASNCATANTSSFTTAAVPIPVPACVSNLSPANGSAINTQTTATLTWNTSANASSYDVYIWTGATPPLIPIASVTTPSYTADNLLAATTYKWYVVPKNQTGVASNCAAANTSSFTTAAAPVPAPPCVTGIAPANGATISTQTTATLSWNSAANASSYDIYFWTDNTSAATPIATVTGTSFTVVNVLPATRYKWYIVAKNQTGAAINCAAAITLSFTTATSIVPIVIPACIINIAPINGIAISSQTTAALSWNTAANATSYDVYLWTGNTAPGAPVANVTGTSFTASGLLSASSYKWYVTPKNQAGTATGCGSSNTSSFITAPVAALLPTCLTNTSPANGAVIATQKNATLSWNALPNATSYNIYIWTGIVPALTPIANTSATSYEAINLAASSLYTWYVVPVNAHGVSLSCGNPNKSVFTTAAAPVVGNGTGLLGLYYNGVALSGFPLLSRVDPVIDLACTYSTVLSPAPGVVPAELYSVRWSGQIASTYSEAYTFYMVSDDGIRLWINGVLLVDNWNNQGAVEKTATINMVAGQKYDIVIDYYQNKGESIAKLSWSSASTAKAVVPQKQLYPAVNTLPVPNCSSNITPLNGATLPSTNSVTVSWATVSTAASYDVYLWTGAAAPSQPVANVSSNIFTATGLTAGTTYNWYVAPKNAAGVASGCGSSNKTSFTTAATVTAGTGLLGTYYNGTSLNGPALLTRIDPVIDFAFTYLTVLSPAPGIVPQDLYSVRWTGQVLPTFSETYTFYTISDDGIRLWVNGVLLVDNWSKQGPTEKSGTITLTAGKKYDIAIEYFENTGESSTKLLWSSASTVKSIVPQSQLYPNLSAAITASVPALSRLSSTGSNAFAASISAAVIPNPVRSGQPARLQISSDLRCQVSINVVSSTGSLVSTQKQSLQAGMNTVYVNTHPLTNGMYFISISGDLKANNIRMLVQ